MTRSRQNQSKHDSEVRKQANSFKRKGFDVSADVRGFPKPETLGGYRPDVIAEKGKQRKIVEVETKDSVGSARDKKQQSAFKGIAKRSENTTFKRVVKE